MDKPDIPETWRWVTLSDIGTILSGGTPSTKEPQFWGDEIPWITPADLSNYENIYISNGKRNISEVGLQYSSASLLSKGSILFSSRAPIGYVAIAANPLATNQGFKNLIVSDFINSKFVYFYLKTIKEQAENLASGTTFLELSLTKFKSIPFPLAPLEEQNRIVLKIEELISQLDYAKENLKSALSKLELKFLKILGKTFSNTFKNEYKLSEIGEWGSGGTPSRKNKSYFGGNIPWVKTQELKEKYISYTDEFLTEEGLKKSSAKIYPKGSIVIAMYGATVGKLSILDIDATTNQACGVGILDSSIVTNEYLYYYLTAFKEKLISQAKGGAQQNISLAIIKDFEISIPDIEVQNEIVMNLEFQKIEIDEHIRNLTNELDRIEILYQKILREAFQGKLSERLVSDIQVDELLVKYKEHQQKISEDKINEKKKPKIGRSGNKNLGEVIFKIFGKNNFTFDDLKKHTELSNDDLKNKLIELIEVEETLVMFFDKKTKSIKYYFNEN